VAFQVFARQIPLYLQWKYFFPLLEGQSNLLKKYYSKNKIMIKRIITVYIFFFIALLSVSNAQDKSLTCADLKIGIFYNYPKNTADQYVDLREGEIEHETNMVTGDTSLWQIKWINDCVYTLKYLSGNVKWNEKAAAFLKKHIMAFEIVRVAADYYVYKSYIDKVSAISIESDTMWLNQKIVVANNNLFKRLSGNAVLKRDHFSDTSKYAIIYLYRPGKLTNSLGNYPVYLDGDIICIAQNNSGYILKIFKEGQFEIKSKLFKDESAVKVNLKFGNTYYVKSMIHWTISSRLYNFKLETAIVNPEKGQKEFEEVKIR
jgi:hypothetical protein